MEKLLRSLREIEVGMRVKCFKPYMNKAEYGIVTSINDFFVFVRYDGDVSSKATNKRDLIILD